MAFINILLIAGIVAVSNCQLFGGPGNIGYRAPIFSGQRNQVSGWGSVAPKPLTFGAGADWQNVRGHGASISALHQPKVGSQATLGGQLGLINTPQHKLNAFGSHTKTFDNHFKEVGRGTNTAGLGYQHFTNNGRTSVDASAQTTFGHGMKPVPQFGLGLTHRF